MFTVLTPSPELHTQAHLSFCFVHSLVQSSLSARTLFHLASALSQERTTWLDMSYNGMGDTGFKVLCTGLGHCNIHILK